MKTYKKQYIKPSVNIIGCGTGKYVQATSVKNGGETGGNAWDDAGAKKHIIVDTESSWDEGDGDDLSDILE